MKASSLYTSTDGKKLPFYYFKTFRSSFIETAVVNNEVFSGGRFGFSNPNDSAFAQKRNSI